LPEHIEYPPNDGFQGEIKQEYLMPGDVVDRYGSEQGKFLSTSSSSIEMRSLPPNTNTNIYNQYQVV
jgi:filamentous hemagglutinin